MSKATVLVCVATLFAMTLRLPSSEAAGKCHQFGISIKEGQSVSAPVGRCMKITCTNASKNQVGAVACPAFPVPKGCRRSKENLTKRYPDCCPKPIC